MLETEVDAESLVEFRDQRWRQSADPLAYPFDCYRADLSRLCFRVAGQARLAGRQQHLERIDASGIGGHRYDGDDSPPESGRRGIGCIDASRRAADRRRGIPIRETTGLYGRAPLAGNAYDRGCATCAEAITRKLSPC